MVMYNPDGHPHVAGAPGSGPGRGHGRGPNAIWLPKKAVPLGSQDLRRVSRARLPARLGDQLENLDRSQGLVADNRRLAPLVAV
jgi:hypothetical protein